MASTSEEQYLLELVNDARLDPMGDAARYIVSYLPDPESANGYIQNAMSYFGVSGSMLLAQYQALVPVQPLAWNDILQSTATAHSQAMLATDMQEHQVPGESNLGQRATAAGYSYQMLGENIFAYAPGVFEAHAAFMIDWGGSASTGGMQSPAGHRINIMTAGFREIGIGIVNGSGATVGPMLVTEDLGVTTSSGVYLLGVAYTDSDHDDFYSIGEGVAGLGVSVLSTSTTSGASGGYSMWTTSTGTRTITLTGAGLSAPALFVANLVSGNNYKLDVVDGHILETSVSGRVTSGVDTLYGLGIVGLTLETGDGVQVLRGTKGNDTLKGGAGVDTGVYAVARADATVTRNADGSATIASTAGGTDTLIGIERVRFADRMVQLVTLGASDFDGSRTSDVLLRNTAGVTYLWSMNGATVSSGSTTSVQVGMAWRIEGVADFDGDGRSDLLWVYDNPSNSSDPLDGISYVSFQNGTSATGGGVVQQLSSDWAIVGVGDFTADGMADVLYRNTATGRTFLDVMNGNGIDWSASGFTTATVADGKWTVAAVADFDGDGMTDVLWRYANAANTADPLNGTLYEWRMNGTTVASAGLLSQQASGAWQVAGTGDFDGDGKADLLFRYHDASNASNPLNGVSYIDFMNGTTVVSGATTGWQVDESWQVASIGDYDGNGKADILWQKASTGDTFLWTMNGSSVTSGAFTSAQAGSGWTVQNGVLIG